MGNWCSESLRINPSIQMSNARYLALKCSVINAKTACFLKQIGAEGGWWVTCHLPPSIMKGLFWCLEMGCVGKKGRKVKFWVGLRGCKCPCLLVLAAEKVMDLRLPLWSEDFHERGELALGNCTAAVVFAGEREKNILGAIGCVLPFRQRNMSNEDFINTSFKIWAVGSQHISDTLQILKKKKKKGWFWL